MKYKYIFIDGTEAEVDVDEETYRVLRNWIGSQIQQ